MIVQPTLDGRAETQHPPRVPHFGPIQRIILRNLAIGPLPDSAFSLSRSSLRRLEQRGYVYQSPLGYWHLTTKE
jgi:hypothetical protein